MLNPRVRKKSIPFEMKPLFEFECLSYYAEVTHPWVQHGNKAFTSNKGFISKAILFFGTPCRIITENGGFTPDNP